MTVEQVNKKIQAYMGEEYFWNGTRSEGVSIAVAGSVSLEDVRKLTNFFNDDQVMRSLLEPKRALSFKWKIDGSLRRIVTDAAKNYANHYNTGLLELRIYYANTHKL